MFDGNICHVTFSHTDCVDIWPAYFGEMDRWFSNDMPHFVCLNKPSDLLPGTIKPIYYTPGETYPRRLLSCLEQLEKYEFVFFDHEDMFLYAKPDLAELEKYYMVMCRGELDHIRLIKGGFHKAKVHPNLPSLYILDLRSDWIFSIQPSFWRRTVLMDILKASLDVNIWQLETLSQKVVKDMQLKAGYSHASGRRRGIFHFDNTVYPYIATAIGKGKWNYSEYKTELGKVFKEYGIDPKVRGWH